MLNSLNFHCTVATARQFLRRFAKAVQADRPTHEMSHVRGCCLPPELSPSPVHSHITAPQSHHRVRGGTLLMGSRAAVSRGAESAGRLFPGLQHIHDGCICAADCDMQHWIPLPMGTKLVPRLAARAYCLCGSWHENV